MPVVMLTEEGPCGHKLWRTMLTRACNILNVRLQLRLYAILIMVFFLTLAPLMLTLRIINYDRTEDRYFQAFLHGMNNTVGTANNAIQQACGSEGLLTIMNNAVTLECKSGRKYDWGENGSITEIKDEFRSRDLAITNYLSLITTARTVSSRTRVSVRLYGKASKTKVADVTCINNSCNSEKVTNSYAQATFSEAFIGLKTTGAKYRSAGDPALVLVGLVTYGPLVAVYGRKWSVIFEVYGGVEKIKERGDLSKCESMYGPTQLVYGFKCIATAPYLGSKVALIDIGL